MKINNVLLAAYVCSSFALACPDHEQAEQAGTAAGITAKAADFKVGNLTISNCWVRPGQTEKNTAAYFTIKNTIPEQEDQLVKAECAVANSVELHDHISDNGVMKMRPVPAIKVKQSAELKPGSLHVMFMGLKQDLKAGEKIEVKLTFEKAGEVVINFPIQQPKV